jgi:hypothetical protein
MKYLKEFYLFENVKQLTGEISVKEYIKKAIPELDPDTTQRFCSWWSENRSGYKIYFFRFNSQMPIVGGIVENNGLAINQTIMGRMPPFMCIFLLLHESKHLDQNAKGDFMSGYFDSVVENNYDLFKSSYVRLEKEANDFAIEVMKQNDFYSEEITRSEGMIRSNERAYSDVYKMMQQDIKKSGAKDFFELIKLQIL